MELQPGDYFSIDKKPLQFAGIRSDPQNPERQQVVARINPYQKGEALHTIFELEDLEQKGDFSITGESRAWGEVLGADVEVKPLPEYITPKVMEKLKGLGMELRYVPALELGDINLLRQKGIEQYLRDLQRVYPNWKPYESLSITEKSDHRVLRNLGHLYWEAVKDGKVDFPTLPGQWLAVETIEKPPRGIKYSRTAFTTKLGIRKDRSGFEWPILQEIFERKKEGILGQIGLTGKPADIRFLEGLEWNLLGNREGWGKTDMFEWTNTKFREGYNSRILVVGNSTEGGAAGTHREHPGRIADYVGFRAAVVLGS